MKLGLIGCSRAEKLIEVISKVPLGFDITGIYDNDKKKLQEFSTRHPTIIPLETENKFFGSDLFDSVYIASPVHAHFRQTLKAFNHEKNVLCEVPAFTKIDEGLKLIEIFKEKNLVYMMAENFCFTPTSIAISKLFSEGYFGEITFLRTAYIHDCKGLSFDDNATELTWRGKARTKVSGNDYPTHSIGPVCKWLGIGRGGDQLTSISSFASQESAMGEFYSSNLSNGAKYNNPFKRGDVSLSILKTKSGAIIELILDTVSNRPSSMANLLIQGSYGAFVSGRFDGEPGILSSTREINQPEKMRFKDLNPNSFLSTVDVSRRESLGKLFPFYKVLENFNFAVLGNDDPAVTIDDAFLWSAIIELSRQSVLKGSAEIPFPELFSKVQ